MIATEKTRGFDRSHEPNERPRKPEEKSYQKPQNNLDETARESSEKPSEAYERLRKATIDSDFAARKTWLTALISILLLSAIAFGSVALTRPKFNRSEIAYAEIAKEMLQKSSWVVPLYRGVPCIDKPVLNYWAIIPCFKLFGAAGWSARIPSIVASLCCLALLAVVVRSLWGWQASLLATMILATSQRFWEFASLCMTDMLLTLFDGVALTMLYAGLKQPKRRLIYFCVASMSMALGTLTKGPVALILPSTAFFLYLITTKQAKILSFRQIIMAATVFFAVAAPWYLAATHAVNTSASVGAWLWHHNIERFFGTAYEWHNSPFYMIGSLFLGFAPWSIFLPFAAFGALRSAFNKSDPEQSQQELFMWIWLVLTTIFFTFSHGKMNYYDLPAFPAAAAITALHLKNAICDRKVLGIGGASILTGALALAAFGATKILPSMVGQAWQLWVGLPVSVAICVVFSLRALLSRQVLASYSAIFVGLCSALIGYSWLVAPAMAKQAPAIEYIKEFNQYPSSRLALHADFAKTIDWFDFALFETGRAPEELSGNADLIAFLQKPGKALVILPEDRFKEIPSQIRYKLRILERKPYMDKKVDLLFLAKNGGHLTGVVPLLLVSN
jgi:4-amino-4-deoxy-L-arabinose transferase-like glycosyltransferase